MATATGSNNDPPLDEIQWRHPPFAAQMQGIHSNSVLMYFAESPFFDRTSNNALLLSQAMVNPSLFPVIQTREAFEARLRTMSGLEFIVAQEPAEMAPGTGTGVWVFLRTNDNGFCRIWLWAVGFQVPEDISGRVWGRRPDNAETRESERQ